jgi:sulfide:quinone oxidoreductase
MPETLRNRPVEVGAVPAVAPTRVVIAGGGVAGLEALIGLRHIAGAHVTVTMVAPTTRFFYKPDFVREPFGGDAARRELEPIVAGLGGRFVHRRLVGVDALAKRIQLDDNSELDYDALLICVGARPRPAFANALTFDGLGDPQRLTTLLNETSDAHHLAFVVPPGVSWPLPIYELALMSRRRLERRGATEARISVVTPEARPLALFGPAASSAVEGLLHRRRIGLVTGSYAHEEAGQIVLTPGERLLGADRVIALPALDGPGLVGLPCDDRGFISIDEYCRVRGVPGVWAAGDGTTFPIKQGGLATQQSDAIVEQVAAAAGVAVEPQPFRPVLRGKLLTGQDNLYARRDASGHEGDGMVSRDYLWWPPHKIAGRFLASYLGHEEPREDMEPPRRPLEVEVALPHEWHRQPMIRGL